MNVNFKEEQQSLKIMKFEEYGCLLSPTDKKYIFIFLKNKQTFIKSFDS